LEVKLNSWICFYGWWVHTGGGSGKVDFAFLPDERRNASLGKRDKSMGYYPNGCPERLPQVLPLVLSWK